MKVVKAKNRGFCYGVKRAIDIAESSLRSKKEAIYCIGPIIHNPEVVSRLEEKGLGVVSNTDAIRNCRVIVPSHGIGPLAADDLKRRGITIIDATCPYVLKSHRIAQNLKKDGYETLIFGDRNHPEIKGLIGIAKDALIFNSINELKKLELKERKIGLVAQTTKSKLDYLKAIEYLLKMDFKELRVFNTICADTQVRQDCVRGLAKKVDLMLVIGGRNSANTRHLAEIAKSYGKIPVYHVESSADLKRSWFKNRPRIGVASGASTPECIIEDVVQKIKEL